jgi:hypothetical protein
MCFNKVCLDFFRSTRGLQQGGPFQRICFLFVADALCAVLKKKFIVCELVRLERNDLKELVLEAWSTPCQMSHHMDIWQSKIRTCRRLTRGWASNVIPEQNKFKQPNAEEHNTLDLVSESRSLSEAEINRMNFFSG